jgi:hypothetical protein
LTAVAQIKLVVRYFSPVTPADNEEGICLIRRLSKRGTRTRAIIPLSHILK